MGHALVWQPDHGTAGLVSAAMGTRAMNPNGSARGTFAREFRAQTSSSYPVTAKSKKSSQHNQ